MAAFVAGSIARGRPQEDDAAPDGAKLLRAATGRLSAVIVGWLDGTPDPRGRLDALDDAVAALAAAGAARPRTSGRP